MRSVSLATKAEWLAASPVQPSVTPGVNSFVVRYSVDAASRVLSELHAQFPAPKLQIRLIYKHKGCVYDALTTRDSTGDKRLMWPSVTGG